MTPYEAALFLAERPGTRTPGARGPANVARPRPGLAADAALHDPLTGLLRSGAFVDRVAAALASPESVQAGSGAVHAVLAIGLDQVARVTENFGHAIRDMLLQRAVERLRRALRSTDLIARTGESEFAVLLVAPAGNAPVVAAHLADLLVRPYLLDGLLVTIGASVGVAVAADGAADAILLRRSAAIALSQARAGGHGQVRLFDSAMARRAEDHHTLELDLRKALLLREFELHYQPQLDVASGRLTGFEALLRWRHPTRGLLLPAAFLPLAEETGLIVPIGEWALHTACVEAASWPGDAAVAVNIAAAQFSAGRLPGVVEAALAASGLPAGRLDIEVTEGILMRADKAATGALHRLHDAGVQISMDDFGTGYSSMVQLKEFPFDKIKIDRSLVADIAHSPTGAVFVRAITMLGAGLGMRTVVEGVETAAQLDRVHAEGGTEVQGYLIGRPAPAADIPAIMADLRTWLPMAAKPRSSDP